jgi:hypothetical protein
MKKANPCDAGGCGLDQVKKSVLEKVIPVWSAKLDAIRTAMCTMQLA